MRQLPAVLFLLILLAGSRNSMSQNNGFDGLWEIDSLKSDFGGLIDTIAAPKSIWVKVIADSISVQRTFGNTTYNEILAFGEEIETIPDANTLKRSLVQWTQNKNEIVFNWFYEVGGNEWRFSRTESWRLSGDKVLQVERISRFPDRVEKVQCIYRRQV